MIPELQNKSPVGPLVDCDHFSKLLISFKRLIYSSMNIHKLSFIRNHTEALSDRILKYNAVSYPIVILHYN